MAKSKNSILFATVPFTLDNKIRRYVPALCELDVKQGRGKGRGGGRGEAKSAEAKQGERERKRHATVADIQRILKRTAPK